MHTKAVRQSLSEVVSNSREIASRFGRTEFPLCGVEIFQSVDLFTDFHRPLIVVGIRDATHIIKVEQGLICRRGTVLLRRSAVLQAPLHVALSRAHPNVAHPHIVDFNRTLLGAHRELVGTTRRHLGKRNLPLSLRRSVSLALLSAQRHVNTLTDIRRSRNANRLIALDDHVVGIVRREFHTAEITRDVLIHLLRQNQRTFGIGMQPIGEKVVACVERSKEVDKPHTRSRSHLLNMPLNLLMPVACATLVAAVVMRYGSHATNPHFRLGICHLEGVNQGIVVGIKLVAEIRPVARVGIIKTEVNHYDVCLKVHGLAKLRHLHVRAMSLAQECRTRMPEILHLITVAQHRLKLHGIGFLRTVRYSRAVCHTIAHTRHTDGVGSIEQAHTES